MDSRKQEDGEAADNEVTANPPRGTSLRRLGRFAAITPPAVSLLLSALSKPAASVINSGAPVSSRQFKEPVSVAALRRAT